MRAEGRICPYRRPLSRTGEWGDPKRRRTEPKALELGGLRARVFQPCPTREHRPGGVQLVVQLDAPVAGRHRGDRRAGAGPLDVEELRLDMPIAQDPGVVLLDVQRRDRPERLGDRLAVPAQLGQAAAVGVQHHGEAAVAEQQPVIAGGGRLTACQGRQGGNGQTEQKG